MCAALTVFDEIGLVAAMSTPKLRAGHEDSDAQM
jgi:hypothetical protein